MEPDGIHAHWLKHFQTLTTQIRFVNQHSGKLTLTTCLRTLGSSSPAFYWGLCMHTDKVSYDISKQQYTKEIMYEGIHLRLQYSRDLSGEFQLDGVLTTDGQNIIDLVRQQALKYFESTL